MFKIFVTCVFVITCSYVQVSQSGSASHIDLSSSLNFWSSGIKDFASEILLEALSSVAPSAVALVPSSLDFGSSTLNSLGSKPQNSSLEPELTTEDPANTSIPIKSTFESTTSATTSTKLPTTSLDPETSKQTTTSSTTAQPTRAIAKNPNQCHKCSNVFQFEKKPSACSCIKDDASRGLKEVSNEERNLHGCCEDDAEIEDDSQEDDEDEQESQKGWKVKWHVKELGKAVARSLI